MSRRLEVLAAVTAAAALAGCGGSSSSGSSSQAAASSNPPAAAAAAATISIGGFAYSPKPLTVTPGEVVTVRNADSAEHTVTSDAKGLFDADAEQGHPITFKAPAKPGTYTFHCAYHASMHGTLVVKSG
jgi:plastocyanin